MSDERRIIDGEVEKPAPAPSSSAVDVYRPSANPFDADPGQFAVQVAQRGENYGHLITWLVDHLVIGEDLVQVHFVKRKDCDLGGPPHCAASLRPHHWSDPDLSRKGAEKICGLLGLATRFLGMDDFRRMALKGAPIEDVIIDCEIYGASGQAMSQGTGAASRSEFGGDLNRAMKAACKRAHVDAVKRIAGLSGVATEIKRRMPPVDPDAAAARPTARAASTGAPRNRWDTGATLTHCPLKAHKDKPWREVPTAYLEWITRECADKPDLHRAAAGELAKRKGASPAGPNSTHTQPSPGSREPGSDDEDPCRCATPGEEFCPIHGEVLNDRIPF